MKEWSTHQGIDTSNIRDFRTFATLPLVIAAAGLITVASFYLWRLFGAPVAIAGAILLAVEPYLVGLNQIVHVDGILALCMLNAILAFWVGNRKSGGALSQYDIWAGIWTGLAFGTKLMPALWLAVTFGGYLTVSVFTHIRSWQSAVRRFGFIVGLAALVFVLLWPATWAKTDNLDQYIARDATNVVTEQHVDLEASEDGIAPPTFYLRTTAGRLTPFTHIVAIGSLLVAAMAAVRLRRIPSILWLFLYAAGFLVLITLVAKKADRYALPALVVVPVIAAWGLGSMWQWYQQARLKIAIGIVLTGALLAQLLTWYPYAIAYTNPFFPNVRPFSQQGWGEGLDAAAAWLNAHPLVDRLYVASWYPSVFGAYFNGKTFSLSSRADHRVGYIVTYRNMHGRGGDTIASDVLDELSQRTPVYTVYINAVPYVWVYETTGLGYYYRTVGELIGPMEVGQIIPVDHDNWSNIEIGLANFSDRANTQDVVFEVFETVDAAQPLRRVTVNAADIANESWQRFAFEPIPNSAGKEYYVALRSPTSVPGDAITVRYVDADLVPGRMVFFREQRQADQSKSQFIRDADIAYRLPTPLEQ